jgi:DNA (cytosine-5)-methyltransferase 1
MSEILLFGDLFAGGGGTTEGVLQAARLLGLETEAIAVNHWPVAVATHVANHGHVRHHCMDLETASPRDLVPGGRLDLLWASPECTHHSRARGGKPVSEQKRAGANWVLDWLEALDVRCLILENVVEWLSWGDVVDDKPVSKTRGKLFVRWWNRLKRLGYRAEYRVLNAADYGDATTRRRLFVQARKDGRPIRWPEPTHSKTGAVGLFGGLPKWKPDGASSGSAASWRRPTFGCWTCRPKTSNDSLRGAPGRSPRRSRPRSSTAGATSGAGR